MGTRHGGTAAAPLLLLHLFLLLLVTAVHGMTWSNVWNERLAPLDGLCREMMHGPYRYQWCHRQFVRQYHSTTPVSLGVFNPSASTNPFRHRYTDGEACGPSGGQREASVKISCCENRSTPVQQEDSCKTAEGLSSEMQKTRLETVLVHIAEPRPCKYELEVCSPIACAVQQRSLPNKESIHHMREEVRAMFTHAYDGYMSHAFPSAELRPVSCQGGDFGMSNLRTLTLIDTLDTLAIMGNVSEFQRAVDKVIEYADFDLDDTVSVFETNIRALGGLLSAHLLALQPEFSRGWGYRGELLSLAHSLGTRLLSAFPQPSMNFATSIPYGTVHLREGVPFNETTIASVAGAGSLSLEFTALSALTGDPTFATVANKAVSDIYHHRSELGLVGKHIDIRTGAWTEVSSGTGTNSDSFYEYLLKMAILFGDEASWEMFEHLYESVMTYQAQGDWYADVHMGTGEPFRYCSEGLQAFWSGIQVLLGDLESASHTLNALMGVWTSVGFLPETYFFRERAVGSQNNDPSYLLRPELIESLVYIRHATKDNSWLNAGKEVLLSLQRWCKTECGYAAIANVANGSYAQLDSMPSFFLSETAKYLYLLFDDALNPDGHWILREPWVFSTEAHPFPIKMMRERLAAVPGLQGADRRRPRPLPECPVEGTEWIASYNPLFEPVTPPPDPAAKLKRAQQQQGQAGEGLPDEPGIFNMKDLMKHLKGLLVPEE